MAQRPRLEVKQNGSGNQEARFQFRIWNESTDETLDVENYRVVVLYYTDSAISQMVETIQAGYDRINIPSGGVSFFTPNVYAYESNQYPTYIEPGKEFNAHLTARFQGIQNLPELPTGGSAVGGCEIRLRRNDYKDYSLVDGNTGTEYIYTSSWSWQGLDANYGVKVGIGLEYNPIDPTNATSNNWELVQSWDDATTPSAVVVEYPYQAANGNINFPTNTDHVWVDCKADTWIDSANPSQNNGTDTELKLSRNFWNGQANSTKRALMFFDVLSELPPGVNPQTDVLDAVVYIHTDNSNQDANVTLDLTDLTDGFNESDELTADWDEYASQYSTVLSSWLTFGNSYNQQERLCIFTLDLSQAVEAQGLGLKYNDEAGNSGIFEYYSREHVPSAIDEEPRLIVRFNQQPQTESNLKSYFVW